MSDVFTKAKRSAVMSLIRGKGNRDTELKMISVFREHGITGWRRNWPLFGRPDFVFPKQRVALFVDGCFWHACPRHRTSPKQNAAFWQEKLTKNVARDRLVTRTLKRQGWKVVRVWECALARTRVARTAVRVKAFMNYDFKGTKHWNRR